MPTAIAAAVAGGTGAFLGAGLGQSIQWLRDRWQSKLDDQRERRATLRDVYLAGGRAADRLAQETRQSLDQLLTLNEQLTTHLEQSTWKTGVMRTTRHLWESIDQDQALRDLHVLGSEAVRRLTTHVYEYADLVREQGNRGNHDTSGEVGRQELLPNLERVVAQVRREVLPAEPEPRSGKSLLIR